MLASIAEDRPRDSNEFRLVLPRNQSTTADASQVDGFGMGLELIRDFAMLVEDLQTSLRADNNEGKLLVVVCCASGVASVILLKPLIFWRFML